MQSQVLLVLDLEALPPIASISTPVNQFPVREHIPVDEAIAGQRALRRVGTGDAVVEQPAPSTSFGAGSRSTPGKLVLLMCSVSPIDAIRSKPDSRTAR